jgi:hypothetical protein|nr:MAG TPA: Mannosyl-glycoprotein endo-beta-N-acetylglucosaminidase [Caudoviricetes sp.]
MLETETIYPGGNPPTEKKGFWKKFEDKMEERRANVFRHKPLSWTVVVWWGLVLFTSIIVMKSCNTTEPVPSQPAFGCEVAEEQVVEPVPETLFDEVYDYIFKLRIDHPDIVMAQCIEESGGFTSKLFVEGHNCLGMKVPGSRPTLAVGTMLGHARFNSWRECIADYAIWQSTFARRLTKDEYFAYLDRVYAEKKGYSSRLKAIIQSRGL